MFLVIFGCYGVLNTSKVIGKNKPKNLLWSRIGVIFRYSNNRMRFFSYLCVQNLTIQK